MSPKVKVKLEWKMPPTHAKNVKRKTKVDEREMNIIKKFATDPYKREPPSIH